MKFHLCSVAVQGGGTPTPPVITFEQSNGAYVRSSVPGATLAVGSGDFQNSPFTFGQPTIAGFSTVDLSQMSDNDATFFFDYSGIVDSPDLNNLVFPSSNSPEANTAIISFAGCGLSATAVDAFFNYLAACFNLHSFSGGAFDTSGGTNAAPTAASAAARALLLTGSNTITTN